MTRSALWLTIAASIIFSLLALPANALVVDPRIGTPAMHPPPVQTPQQLEREQAGPKSNPGFDPPAQTGKEGSGPAP